MSEVLGVAGWVLLGVCLGVCVSFCCVHRMLGKCGDEGLRERPKPLTADELQVKGYSTVVVVGAENKEQALEFARDEITSGDFEIEEMKVEREIKPEDLERSKQLANAVSEEYA